MKKWTGGILILALTLLLALRYSLLTTVPPRRRPPPPSAPRFYLLRSLPGLADLNLSNPSPTAQILWTHLLPLLRRSDALPATADAVREASAAWRELTTSFIHPPSPSLTNCPFSVAGSAGSLEIPCGLVQGSAVTVVGLPVGRRFNIELLGSPLLAGNGGPPVVLRCNVSLGGDDLVTGPAVAMSAWTAERGWGQWEHCPAHGAAAAAGGLKVDGLVRCNEQFGESIIPENVNGSQLNSTKAPEKSKRSSILSVNFPFIELQPFTATLWVGEEGFHMTVNGRHEFSFAYRERLEPWSVSEVRIDEDLDLLSCLANGLPVSEDMDSIEVETLKAPPIPKGRIFLLVGVFSSANNFNRRMAIRRSWMQYEAVRSGVVAVRFLTGLHKNKQVNMELWREAQLYGDIQLMPFVDYYSLITLKAIGTFILGTKILPAKFIMKTDDDAFVRIDEVLSSLKKNASHGLLYGLISFESSPNRDKDSKWFINPEEWPHELFPPWAHGPGYVVSRDIAKFIVQGHRERNLQLFKLEDVAVGIWIEEFKKSGREVHYVNDDRFHNVGCESDYILAHYQGPRLLLCLWEKLQKDHEPICCEQFAIRQNFDFTFSPSPAKIAMLKM